MGYYGLPWDHLGVNDKPAVLATGRQLLINGGCT